MVAKSFDRGILKSSLTKVQRVRFKRAIYPGDMLEFLVQIAGQDKNVWQFKGQALVGQEIAAETTFSLNVDFREVGFEI